MNPMVYLAINEKINDVYNQTGGEQCHFISIEINTLRTHSCNVILKFEQSDSVHIEWLEIPTFINMDERYNQASFKGFLYAPTNQMSIAWDARV